MDKILEKIKKLVAHQESAKQMGSTEEAEAFAVKIQALLNKYNLSLAQLPADKIEEDVIDLNFKTKIPSIGGRSNFQIYSAIAKNNWCKVYLDGGVKNNFILVGSPQNVEIVKFIASIVRPIFVSVGKQKYKNEYLPDCTWKPVGLDTYMRRFIQGCADGLNMKLAKEREEFIKDNDTAKAIEENGISCTALIKVNEVAITNHVEAKYGGTSKARRNTATKGAKGAYQQGVEVGKNVSIHKGVEASKPINQKMLK